jgi:hypothetical protein
MPSRLDHSFLIDLGVRVCGAYNTYTGTQITSNIDHLEDCNFVEEMIAHLESYGFPSHMMEPFFERITFCQESEWHVDTFSWSVMIILKSNGHSIMNDYGETVYPNSGDVILLKSDIRHKLNSSPNCDSFVFVAFDIEESGDMGYFKAKEIFDNLT